LRVNTIQICDRVSAIARVHPFGVDVRSGVRTGGALDEKKLPAFMAAVHLRHARQ